MSAAIHINVKFVYKNGKIEHGCILHETPFSYYVQFNKQLFGSVYKEELETVDYTNV